jgi:hypothetical protein
LIFQPALANRSMVAFSRLPLGMPIFSSFAMLNLGKDSFKLSAVSCKVV